MISKINEEVFDEENFLELEKSKINFHEIKKNKKLLKYLYFFLMIFGTVFIIMIIFKSSKLSLLNNTKFSLNSSLLKEKKQNEKISENYDNKKKENERIKAQIKDLKIEIKNINDQYDYFSDIFYPYKSDIIKSNDELNYIRNLFEGNKIEMIYKSSINKNNQTIFYNRTKKNSNLILILTDKGKKIGAYTSLNFEERRSSFYHESKKIDNEAFLFSLNEKKKFNVIKDKYALYCDDEDLIQFGEIDLLIPNNYLEEKSQSNFPKNFEGDETDIILLFGEHSFRIQELEVFHIGSL